MLRRNVIKSIGLGGLAAIAPAAAQERAPRITFEAVKERARRLSLEAYRPAPDDLPPELGSLTYDDYQAIRFEPRAELKLNERFAVQFFHRGFLHGRKVTVNLQPRSGAPSEVAYRPDLFDLGRLNAVKPSLAPTLGFAGWRLHYAFAGEGAPAEEFAVFLGASYFRLIGQRQQYGLSARAVAVDTGLPRPEEFPSFREFWLVEPEPGSPEMEMLALVDGPSLAGAYRFRIAPGAETQMRVEAAVYPRGFVERLGLAVLTSMFLQGDNGPRFDDFRPKVHDSDGLLIQTGEEGWAWRPLVNGRQQPRVTAFPTGALRGFGLLQRDRRYSKYLDVQARHEDRPGLWIEPEGAWGAGEVQLYEIPSVEEYQDNIVAYWVPRDRPAGRPVELAYRMRTVSSEPLPLDLARVATTRLGSAERLRPTTPPSPERRYFVIDFEGPGLPPAADAAVTAETSASEGRVVEPVVERVPQTGGWRLYLEHRPGTGVAEIRARLVLNGRPLTEWWRYSL